MRWSADGVRPAVASVGVEEDVVPSGTVVQGRLQSSEVLTRLDFYLPDALHVDCIVELILSHKPLFSDVPSGTTVMQHDTKD